MRQNKSIIYVNFAPYENAGRILDFLIENFTLVILFSFDFHELKNYHSNQIKIFCDGKIIQEIKLFKLPTPEFLLFPTIPLIAFIIALQTIWYVLSFKRVYGKFHAHLTVNAFTAWIGNLLKNFRIVDKSIFWVWDYYPPSDPNWKIRIVRWVYWKFDKISTKSSSSVIFLNKRLEDLRKEIGILPKNSFYPIVPIGTNPRKTFFYKKTVIGHIGVLKKSQGLDLLFNNLAEISKNVSNLKVEILGSGPDEQYFKLRAKRFSNVKFYGFIEEDDQVDQIIKNWSIGLATYIPEKSNGAYWTDPSKIKLYISQGVPVIATEITGFADEIRKNKAGIVIDYYDAKGFTNAILNIIKNKNTFIKNSYDLSIKYNYRKIYKQLFNFPTKTG